MKEIARHAEVSLGTVSHVINRSAGVRPELQMRVNNSIRALGYQPSQLARGLRRSSTNLIGMVIPDITNPFFPTVVRGAEDVAFGNSFRLVLCNTDNDPRKEQAQLEQLLSFSPAGLLIIPAPKSNLSATIEAAGGQVPVVCVDRCPSQWQGDTAVVANAEGAAQAAHFLLKLGHKKLAVIAGPANLANAVERLQGFRGAIEEAGLRLPAHRIIETQLDRQSGYQATLRLLKGPSPPTAIFASNDLIAVGVFQAARELKVRCPADLSVVGFDDVELAAFTDPPLTTVRQPGYDLGSSAMRLLLERIGGRKGPAQRVILATDLAVRGSAVAPPR